MGENFYRQVRAKVEARSWVKKTVIAAAKLLPLGVYICYPLMVLYVFLWERSILGEVLLYPLVGVLTATCLRAGINEPRPYEVMELPPLTRKDTRGKSFPSRHAACAGVIAVTGWWIDPLVGILLSFVAVGIAASRVLTGVHFLRDVTTGLLLGVAIGLIGFVM